MVTSKKTTVTTTKPLGKISRVSQKCIDLIEEYECSGDAKRYLNAYLCPAGVATIGIGTTVYPNGKRVKMGDKCSLNDAYNYLRHDLLVTENLVDSYTVDTLTQQQFDSLVSFSYNVGIGNFKTSSLLKKVNKNPNDSSIQKEFEKWTRADGEVVPGLVRRRKSEAWLYFHGSLKYNF
jgi:lysozyme